MDIPRFEFDTKMMKYLHSLGINEASMKFEERFIQWTIPLDIIRDKYGLTPFTAYNEVEYDIKTTVQMKYYRSNSCVYPFKYDFKANV